MLGVREWLCRFANLKANFCPWLPYLATAEVGESATILRGEFREIHGELNFTAEATFSENGINVVSYYCEELVLTDSRYGTKRELK